MQKRASVIAMLALAAMLAACGPTVGTDSVTGPTATPEVVSSPEPVGELAECEGRIAFVGRVGGEWDVLVINADGSGSRTLADGVDFDSRPVWAP